jgi:hypothetical protein
VPEKSTTAYGGCSASKNTKTWPLVVEPVCADAEHGPITITIGYGAFVGDSVGFVVVAVGQALGELLDTSVGDELGAEVGEVVGA